MCMLVAMSGTRGTLAVVVGGGPAPGINAVIAATTIEAINEGFTVLGVQDGFKWLVQRDASKVRELSIPDVSRIHLAGGSFLGTSRENPTRSPERLAAVVETLLERGCHVFALNPKQLDRFRDRHTVAGAKDDRRDAWVLADA